jgi:citrate lyase subunit beta/citryl-CoA lyase
VIARSYLYVPGDSGDRLERAPERGADAVIADLEDAVAPARKSAAVEAVSGWLAYRHDSGVQRWVRVNAGERGPDDLRAVFGPGLDGVVIPKAAPDEVRQILDTLSELERERGATGQVALMPLIETARGLRDVDAVAGHPRVGILQLGELDLAADLGLSPAPDEAELLYARSRVVTSSAAAGLLPPVAAVSPDFTDLDGYRVSTERLRRLGFVGRAVIHPAQLPVVHDVFTPDPGEVAAARRTLAAYEAALLSGSGVMTDQYGRMVDEAVIRASRRTVALTRVPQDSKEAHT